MKADMKGIQGMPGRVKFGIEKLDAMLGGGLLPGALTVVYGATGAGKTQLGLTFGANGEQFEKHKGIIFDMTTRGDSQRHEEYSKRLFGWELQPWGHSVWQGQENPFPSASTLEAMRYCHEFDYGGRLVDYQVRKPEGRLVSVEGQVELLRGSQSFPATNRISVETGDVIWSGTDGRAAIILSDGTQLKLTANSTVQIKQVSHRRSRKATPVIVRRIRIIVQFFLGEIRMRRAGRAGELEIETPTATAATKASLFRFWPYGNSNNNDNDASWLHTYTISPQMRSKQRPDLSVLMN